MIIFYISGLAIYKFGIRIASLWNPKARLWLEGRKNQFSRMEAALKPGSRIIWIHCASLGEFEQGRPVLEGLKKDYPHYQVLLTFFSPSGFEVRKNYDNADHIYYLPLDSPQNANRFIKLVKPSMAIFIKYEFWHYYLSELKKNKIPALLVSGIFRKNQPFFRFYGGFWRNMLNCFTKIFVQDQVSLGLLQAAGFGEKTIISGDTRFDRVIEIASAEEKLPEIDRFCRNYRVIVAGSTWIEDEEVLDHYARVHPEIRFIIAPHEIHETRLKEIEKLFRDTIRYSALAGNQEEKNQRTLPHVLIIDNIGMLATLYRYADITYVGGGFGGDGIHNILEAAVYGRPVVFGPVYDKFREAEDLIENGAAISIENAIELESTLDQLMNNDELLSVKRLAAKNYVLKEAGATAAVLKYIQENRLLTS